MEGQDRKPKVQKSTTQEYPDEETLKVMDLRARKT
jgi:hypothetical protein